MLSQKIPLKDILADKEFNVRTNLGGVKNADPKSETDKDTTIEKLASEIRRDGLINPLLVRINKAGKYELVAGFRRHAALSILAKEDPAKYAAVEVRVHEGDEEEAYFLNMSENTARENLTSYEIGSRCYFLVQKSKEWNKDGKPHTHAYIADRVGGHSRGYISNLIRAFESLHPELIKRWEKESTGTTGDGIRHMLTDRINKLSAEKDKTAQLDMKVFEGGLSWNEVKAGIKPTEGAKEGDAKAETESEGPSRPSPKVLQMTLDFVKSDDCKADEKTTVAVVQAIEFVLGKRKTLFGFNPEKAIEAEKAAKEEERAALKEQKEAEKLAAKEEKEKQKAKATKNGKADAGAEA